MDRRTLGLRLSAVAAAAILSGAAAPGCSGEEANSQPQRLAKIYDNVEIFNGSQAAQITVEKSRLIFPREGFEGLLKKQPGDVLVSDRASVSVGKTKGDNPSGFLRKVRSVKAEGDRIIVETGRANITDAVAEGQGSLRTKVDISPNGPDVKVQGLKEGPGYKLNADILNIADQQLLSGTYTTPKVKYGANKQNEVSATISLSASIKEARVSFDPTVDLGIDIGLSGLNEFHAILTGNLEARLLMSMQATATVSTSLDSPGLNEAAADLAAQLASVSHQSRKLGDAEWGIPLPTFFVGPVPVASDLRIRVEPGCTVEFTGTASVEGGFQANSSVTMGVRYLNGDWQPVRDHSFSFSSLGPTVALSGGVQATCSLVPSIGVMFYGGAGPFIYADFSARASANVACAGDTPAAVASFALNRTLNVGVGARLQVLEHTLAEKKVDLFGLNLGSAELNVPLGQGSLCGHAQGDVTCDALKTANSWSKSACQGDDSETGVCKGQGLETKRADGTTECKHCCNPDLFSSPCFGKSNGLWCGEALNPDSGALPGWLYHCEGDQVAASNACPNLSCYVNEEVGVNDGCNPDICYGLSGGVETSLNGWFCGQTDQHKYGQTGTLYQCQNGQMKKALPCPAGECIAEGEGLEDHCKAIDGGDPCAALSFGWWCDADMTKRRLCVGNATADIEECPTGCHKADPGFDDYCEASCPLGKIECDSSVTFKKCEPGAGGVPAWKAYSCVNPVPCYASLEQCAGCDAGGCNSTCKTQGQGCSTNLDCCDGLTCSAGVCQAPVVCKKEWETCSGSQCCSGLECKKDPGDNTYACQKPAFCGDGSCNNGETCSTCSQDCGACCKKEWETCSGSQCCSGLECKKDPGDNTYACQKPAFCGDGSCNNGETCSTCSQDCGACCKGEWQTCSGSECCSGLTCQKDPGDNTYACQKPPVCGDGTCNGTETCSTCSQDCGTCCKKLGETCSGGGCCTGLTCQKDPGDNTYACLKAPVCGDGTCNGTETVTSCFGDCCKAKGTVCTSSSQCCSKICKNFGDPENYCN